MPGFPIDSRCTDRLICHCEDVEGSEAVSENLLSSGESDILGAGEIVGSTNGHAGPLQDVNCLVDGEPFVNDTPVGTNHRTGGAVHPPR